MTMAIPEQQPILDMIEGTQVSLTRRDANMLDSYLQMFETALHMAFATGAEIPFVPKDRVLYIAANTARLREAIERNSKPAHVSPETDSTIIPEPGGAVYPDKIYTVRQEVGQMNKLAAAPKWVWITHGEIKMTGADFRQYDIPQEMEDNYTITRCRIRLISEDGKILRERFNY